MPIAQRLASKLGKFGDYEPQIGLLDINLYRDDLSSIADHPVLRKTEIPFKVDGSVARVELDPDLVTLDIDRDNNRWLPEGAGGDEEDK